MPNQNKLLTNRAHLAMVDRVDPINREMHISVGNSSLAIYVPPGCPVLLRGERVRFRVLQPNDLVRGTYVRRPEGFVAEELEIRTRSR